MNIIDDIILYVMFNETVVYYKTRKKRRVNISYCQNLVVYMSVVIWIFIYLWIYLVLTWSTDWNPYINYVVTRFFR